LETTGEKLASWTAIIIACIAAAALYFNAPDWSLPVGGTAIATAVLIFVARHQVPNRFSLLRNAVIYGLACFAACLAIFAGVWNGYGDLVKLIIAVTSLVVAIGGFIIFRAYMHALFRVDDVALASSPATLSGHFPRTPPLDDPQSVAFYPDLGKLGALAAFQTLFLLAVLIGIAWLVVSGGWSQQIPIVFCLVLVGPALGYATACSLSRLAGRTPTMVLTKEGIFDGGTLWWTGLGLILWEEMTGFYCSGRGHGGSSFSRRFLVIMLADPKAVRARQSRLRRVLLLLVALESASPVAIPQQLLPMTVEELADQIQLYVERIRRGEVSFQLHDLG
jgi:hypothetical protein